jgi:hypothetical protein
MKLLRILPLALILFAAACKKDDDPVSTVVTASRPTVTFAGVSITGDIPSIDNYSSPAISEDQSVFMTLPVGANVSLTPTSLDSLTGETLSVETVRDGKLNTAVPGLYVYEFKTAKNRYAYGTRVRYYIGVSDVPNSVDLSADPADEEAEVYSYYDGVIGASTDTLQESISVLKKARAMYLISDPVADRSSIGAIFVHTSDSTIAIGPQPTELGAQSYGDISGMNGRIRNVSGDTVITYQLSNEIINAQYPASTTYTLIKRTIQ